MTAAPTACSACVAPWKEACGRQLACSDLSDAYHAGKLEGWAQRDRLAMRNTLVIGLAWVSSIILALLSGCAVDAYGEPTEEEARVTDAALRVWTERYGDLPACHAQRASLAWQELNYEDVQGLCSGAGDGEHVGCTRYMLDGTIRFVIHDSPYEKVRQRTMAHELTHWLGRCSGRWESGDPQHTDKEIWPVMITATMEAM